MNSARVLLAVAAVLLAAASAWAQDATAPPRTLTTGTADNRPQPSAQPETPQPSAKTVTPQSAANVGGAETIALDADTSKGFARVLFRWPRAVTFTANVSDGILVVTFARPFRLPPDRNSLPLDSYVSVIKHDADGKTLRLSLKQKVRLHTSIGGPLVAIDLLPAAFAGEPDDVADPTAKPPAPPKGVVDVRLNIGVTSERTRLAFDWGETVKYDAKITAGKIAVSFAREGKIDIARLNENAPAFVKGARVSPGDDLTLLEIDVDPGSPVKHFRNKTRIVFDIGAPVNDGDAEPEIALPVGLTPEPAAKPEEAAKAEHAGESHDAPPADAHASPADAHETPPAGSDGAAVEDTHEKKPAEAKPAHDEANHPAEAAAATPAEAAPIEAPVFKTVRDRADVVLTLPALDSEGVAMFKRGDAVIVVLDGLHEIDAEAIAKQNRDIVAGASAGTIDGATVLTMRLLKPYAVSAGQAGHGWTATLSADPLEPPRPVALLRDARSVGPAKVRATLHRGTRTIRLTDPGSGADLLVVPATGEPQSVVGTRSYVEFSADATAQGLLIRPLADDLTVTPGQDEVVIGTPGGLTLSAGTVSDYAPGREAIGGGLAPAAMDFDAWAGKDTFLNDRSRLVNAIQPDGKSNESSRIALARFYLSRDLGAEALGELQLVVADDEGVGGDPAFRALRATALLMLGRHQAASEELATSALDDDPNAALLRGLAAAGLGRWSMARDDIVGGEDAIGGFRADWQARFRIAGARAAVETNAVDVADRMLGAMPSDGVPRPLAIEADLVRGMLALRLKRDAEALRLFGEVKASGYRPLAVRASLAEIVLRERTGALKREDAIKALDTLRWQWRGDDLELSVLHRLGGLQIAGGDYRSGLQTMRSAVLGFPLQDETRRISAEMAALFEDLFLRGKADALPPIQALGLYYDFKELTPIGAMGDDMVRKLADRLIAVDLLEQAAELLQHQVDKRLDGVARAQIAAKLAAVYLMDRKPEKALTALRTSIQTRLPDDIAAQRRLLMGRALSDLKQYDAALEAFEQDDTPEARRLRADVQWAGSRWTEAAVAIEMLLDGREKVQRALDAGERYDVLRAAVAYTMAGDESGLGTLRDRFLTLLAESPEAVAFEMVTRAVDPSGIAFRDMAKAVAATDTLDAFLQSLGLGRPANGSASSK